MSNGGESELCGAVELRRLVRRPVDARVELDDAGHERGRSGIHTLRHLPNPRSRFQQSAEEVGYRLPDG